MKSTIIKLSLVLFLFTASNSNSVAQQYVQFTHYMYNTLAINPAYAGSHDMLNITGLYRNQWVGLNGAPNTASIYAHTPIWKGLNLGVSVVNDEIGPIALTNLAADLAYSFQVSKRGKLAFGIKSGGNFYQATTNSLVTISGNDPSVQGDFVKNRHFTIGAGAYYHTDNFYVGFSSPTILRNKLELGASENIAQLHYYFITGGIFDINNNLKFKPSGSIKMVKNSPFSVDLSGQFLINEKLWLGLMHRFGDSFGALVGYQFSPQFKMGYSYDLTSSQLRSVNDGSHEVFISYDFNFNSDKIVSPRYF